MRCKTARCGEPRREGSVHARGAESSVGGAYETAMGLLYPMKREPFSAHSAPSYSPWMTFVVGFQLAGLTISMQTRPASSTFGW